jgi:hypothetical protein
LWMTSFFLKIQRTVEYVMLFCLAVMTLSNTVNTVLLTASRGFAISGFTKHGKRFS